MAKSSDSPLHPRGQTAKQTLGVTTKLVVSFSLLFIVMIAAIQAVELWGLPPFGFPGLLERARTEAMQDLRFIADLKTERLLRWIREREGDLRLAADDPLLQRELAGLLSLNPDLCKKEGPSESSIAAATRTPEFGALVDHLNQILLAYGVYHSALIWDARSGCILVSTEPDQIGKSRFSESIPSLPQSLDELYVGDICPCERTERPTIHMSAYLGGSSSSNGHVATVKGKYVLTFDVNPQDMVSPLLRGGTNESEEWATLLDANHKPFSDSIASWHSYQPISDARRQQLNLAVSILPDSNGSIIGHVERESENILAVYRMVECPTETNWGVLVFRDVGGLLGPLWRTYAYATLLTGILGIIAACLIVTAVAWMYTKPIHELSTAARTATTGDLSVRANVHSRDQIGLLAATFNEMISHLEGWHGELERNVSQRTKELTAANEELISEIQRRREAEIRLSYLNNLLAEKNRELETLFYVASHDLRSPLLNIQGFALELNDACAKLGDMIKNASAPTTGDQDGNTEAMSKLLTQDIPEALGFITAGASKMDALLQGLLRVSRLGRTVMCHGEIDTNNLIRSVLAATEYQLKEAGVHVTVDDLPHCFGDRTLLGQLFSNLVDNAIKYRSRDRDPIIEIRGSKVKNSVVYTVRDNGMGIAPNHQERVFEIFQRLNPDFETGEGLGLTIALRIIERHNGRIWVESGSEHGSTFFVSLPVDSGLIEGRFK